MELKDNQITFESFLNTSVAFLLDLEGDVLTITTLQTVIIRDLALLPFPSSKSCVVVEATQWRCIVVSTAQYSIGKYLVIGDIKEQNAMALQKREFPLEIGDQQIHQSILLSMI
jgi:hypothetical protein